MKETKRGFKWWWPWEADKIETYLEEMSRQGWTVSSSGLNCMDFVFKKTRPNHIRACVDYQRVVTPEYKALFLDAGWSLLYERVGWYLWIKEYPKDGERPEIYTDKESLIQRNRNMLVLVGAVLLMQPGISSVLYRMLETEGPGFIPFFVLYAAFVLLLTYGFAKLAFSIHRLRKSIRR